MAGNLLLDTNIIIALFALDAQVKQRLAQATEVFVPSIVLGELYYGARKSSRVAANVSRLGQFASNVAVLNCDEETAQQYGLIKSALRVKERPIPENDIWIAAVAQQHQLTLVSRDEHFLDVDGLALDMW